MDKWLNPTTIALIIAIAGFLYSCINFFITRAVTTKIMTNDLAHLESDVKELKKENKDEKIDLKKDLMKIFNELSEIRANQVRRDAICDERHKDIR